MTPTTLNKDGSPAVIIDPSELMIGNILEYKGKLIHVTTLTLDFDDENNESIGFCELGKTTGEICDWNRALCDGLKPLKLSAELLKRAGFVDFITNKEMSLEFLRLGETIAAITCFDKTAEEISLSLELEDRDTDYNHLYLPFLLSEVKYFHQLQNIYFALTNKRLVIK